MYLNLALLIMFLSFFYGLYNINNTIKIGYPKMYIIEKYNNYLIEHYKRIFDISLDNDHLKKDMIEILKDIISITSFYEFDVYFKNESYVYYDQKIPKYIDNLSYYQNNYINNKNITYYHDFINNKNELIDNEAINIRSQYLTNINLRHNVNNFDKKINNYFLGDILNMNNYFLYHFAKNYNIVKPLLDENKDNSYIYSTLFEYTIDNSKFNELFYVENNSIYKLISEDLKVLNKRYKCIEIINNKCPFYNINNTHKKVLIRDVNYNFGGEYKTIIKCCSI